LNILVECVKCQSLLSQPFLGQFLEHCIEVKRMSHNTFFLCFVFGFGFLAISEGNFTLKCFDSLRSIYILKLKKKNKIGFELIILSLHYPIQFLFSIPFDFKLRSNQKSHQPNKYLFK